MGQSKTNKHIERIRLSPGSVTVGETEELLVIKKTKPRGGKPFVPGDPRINRKGRPVRNFNAARALFQDVFSEYMRDEQGYIMIDEETGFPLTVLKFRMRQAALSESPAEFLTALTYSFGKPKDEVDLTVKNSMKIIRKIGIDTDQL